MKILALLHECMVDRCFGLAEMHVCGKRELKARLLNFLLANSCLSFILEIPDNGGQNEIPMKLPGLSLRDWLKSSDIQRESSE